MKKKGLGSIFSKFWDFGFVIRRITKFRVGMTMVIPLMVMKYNFIIFFLHEHFLIFNVIFVPSFSFLFFKP